MFLGSGLGYRKALRQQILAHSESIDFLEIIADGFITGYPWDELGELRERFPMVPHGVSLSIGSCQPLDRSYLRKIKNVSDFVRAPYYSEHLCMSSVPGLDMGHLCPLAFTEDVLEHTIRRVRQVRDLLEKQLVLENVTYTLEVPGATMSQPEFFDRLVAGTGCGILLDVTNVCINASNHAFDRLAFLEAMPLESLVQCHLAGGHTAEDGMRIDSHDERVEEDSWALLAELATRAEVKGVILEHDSNFPDFKILVAQLDRARSCIARHLELRG